VRSKKPFMHRDEGFDRRTLRRWDRDPPASLRLPASLREALQAGQAWRAGTGRGEPREASPSPPPALLHEQKLLRIDQREDEVFDAREAGCGPGGFFGLRGFA
jgi:hypothetical protein